jgi:hypothetical protein
MVLRNKGTYLSSSWVMWLPEREADSSELIEFKDRFCALDLVDVHTNKGSNRLCDPFLHPAPILKL